METNQRRMELTTEARVRWCRRQLLKWYAQHGRVFSWRAAANLFQKIVTEVLLQRTQAQTVERIFPSFFGQFNSWQAIHAADVEMLGNALRPIGLWRRRAVALKALGEEMVRRGGVFPKDRAILETLPAVGQYVANAILLFVHQKPSPLLDTNMARVLERVFEPRVLADIRYDPGLQNLAHKLVQSKYAVQINWAVLDVGALHCRPKNPACDNCPLCANCSYALTQNRVRPKRLGIAKSEKI